MEKYGYIYIHTNRINGHRYVGQSTQDPTRRFRKDDENYNAYKTCPAMYAALLKYGWGAFDTELVVWVDSQDELNKLEEYYINLYHTADSTNGYNTVRFSEGRGKQAESTKEKIGKRQIEYNKKLKENGIVKIAPNRIEHRFIEGAEYKHCVGNNNTSHWTNIKDFGLCRRTWDGLHNKCRKCHNDYVRISKKGTTRLLTDDEMAQSYKDRSDALSEGQKRRYQQDPAALLKLKEQNKKSITRIDISTGETKTYESGLAAKADGFNNTYVSQCCNGQRETYLGYKWRFSN
jgi:GIY-YIG catalytic domain